jgi:protein-disulfide isomerase
METYAGSGDVRFEYKHFAFIGNESVKAAEAAECAAEQDMFWPYHDTIFANQRGENVNAYSTAALKNFASALGMDTAAFNDCLDSGKYSRVVRNELTEGRDRGVTSTPTLFVNGEEVRGAVPFDQLQSMVETILANQ